MTDEPARGPIYTIGHSTRTFDEFTELLRAAGVRAVADVRRFPASRRHPHFAKDALAAALAEEGIAYQHFPDLGGFRGRRTDSPHTAWRNEMFRSYADHMESPAFAQALDGLEAWAGEIAVAVMCAEAVPFRCHRQLLADALIRDGFEVIDILGPGSVQRRTMTPFARVEGGRIIYDGGESGLFDEPREEGGA